MINFIQPIKHFLILPILFLSINSYADQNNLKAELLQLLNKQSQIFSLSQQQTHLFDEKLDLLHKQLQGGIKKNLTVNDQKLISDFNKIKSKTNNLWMLSEKYSHKLITNYKSLALKTTQNEKILNHFYSKIDPNTYSFSPDYIIFLCDALMEIHHELRADSHSKNLMGILNKLDNKLIWYKSQAQNKAHFPYQKIDNAIQNELNTLDQQSQLEDLSQSIQDIEPSPNSSGQINGSQFPEGNWSLTFDDGPSPLYTRNVFSILNTNNIKATFFILSENLVRYAEISLDAGKFGFSRGNHSYSHQQLTKINSSGLNHEINDSTLVFTKYLGNTPTLFRCPYGACGPQNSVIRQMIAQNNMISVMWNVDTLDWQDKNPTSIFNRARKQIDIQKRGIILFHDIHPQSVQALPLVINYVKSKYQFVHLPDMIGHIRGRPFESP